MVFNCAVPRPIRRGVSRSSRTLGAGCGGRVDAAAWFTPRRRTARRARRNRAVLIPRRWYQACCGAHVAQVMVAKTPGAPGRTRISRKAIARGGPDVAARPVVPAACIFCCRRAMGVANTRPSPRPLFAMRAVGIAKLGQLMPREGDRMSCSVIASEAKQSRFERGTLDCFGALAPRNDGDDEFDGASSTPRRLGRSRPLWDTGSSARGR